MSVSSYHFDETEVRNIVSVTKIQLSPFRLAEQLQKRRSLHVTLKLPFRNTQSRGEMTALGTETRMSDKCYKDVFVKLSLPVVE